MTNTSGADIFLQADDPQAAALFYVEQLGFEIKDMAPDLIRLSGQQINLFIEQGPPLGPILEVTVADVAEAKTRLLAEGCQLLRQEPHVPRTYLRDPFGLVYSLTAAIR